MNPRPRVDEVPLAAELRWVLARAFGPPNVAVPSPERASTALDLALSFGVASRIAARNETVRLRDELGEKTAETLTRHRLAVEIIDAHLISLARELAELAHGADVPLVGLKFLALRLRGHVLPGWRRASDLDILLPSGQTVILQALLRARGWSAPSPHPPPHHLGRMVSPDGVVLELHTRLPGVHVRGHRFARFADLQAAGLIEPPAPALTPMLVPARPLLTAHLLAHGLAQHGNAPRSYPRLQMVADLIDIGLATDSGEELVREAGSLIRGRALGVSLDVVRSMCVSLAAPGGDLLAASARLREAALLRHLLAGTLDPRYAAALTLRGLLRPLSESPWPLASVRRAGRIMFAPRSTLDAIRDPSAGSTGPLGRRLRRTLRLLVSAVRAVHAAFSVGLHR